MSADVVRPHNSRPTWLFRDLVYNVFVPLEENRRSKHSSSAATRPGGGQRSLPKGPPSKENIIERFISRWRTEVGADLYPAFRLIVPQRDKSRSTYGLKEANMAKIMLQVLNVTKTSDDGDALINWKQPMQSSFHRSAGDFAGRCFEILAKRPYTPHPNSMSITEINDFLDELMTADQASQVIIFSKFYMHLSAEELMWLIRVILQQMKIGMTEKTLFNIWHPDAESLFNVSSDLRRVCWDLHNPEWRLPRESHGLALMQCFQPQLAQFQSHNLKKMFSRLQHGINDQSFWIEEKLDGERMQLHAVLDASASGSYRFGFWSRKSKDYTYLYGRRFDDRNSALTQHLNGVFDVGVRSIILDGEMITWDPIEDSIVPFGTLKTAAVGQIANPYDSSAWRPFFKVFDILYLNGADLTSYALADRRKALDHAVHNVHRRLEKHTYQVGHSIDDIEPALRRVVAETSEGLVLKNPRSSYKLNERNDDWTKVKPEYMNEFGENLDCLIIGGYYGSGSRGGKLSSFLCGLRVDDPRSSNHANLAKFYSFFKVGGGFSASDYAAIRHLTEGKWHKWDVHKPPTESIALAGDGQQQYERPDEWIHPEQSVVIEVKAASVASTEHFKTNMTLRFPRFRRLRTDRSWQNALSLTDFIQLKAQAEKDKAERRFELEQNRRKKPRLTTAKPVHVLGTRPEQVQSALQHSKFQTCPQSFLSHFTFCVLTSSSLTGNLTKVDLEDLIKRCGGLITQNRDMEDAIKVGDKQTVHVASLLKRKDCDVLRTQYLLDQFQQNQRDGSRPPLMMPQETIHFLRSTESSKERALVNTDEQNDSYVRDTSVVELKQSIQQTPYRTLSSLSLAAIKETLL